MVRSRPVIPLVVAGGLLVASCWTSPDQFFDPAKGPRITALTIPSLQVAPGSTLNLGVTAKSQDDSKLFYRWDATGGILSDPGSATPVWVAPPSAFGQGGQVTLTVRVLDEKGRQDSRHATLTVAGDR